MTKVHAETQFLVDENQTNRSGPSPPTTATTFRPATTASAGTANSNDQRGVAEDHSFDSADRLATGTAASLGFSGILDDSVRPIGASYDEIGQVLTTTSYSHSSGTSVFNQIEYE